MAHWAELDKDNIVTRVLVTSNEEPDEGYQWLVDNLGGHWVKTSYNGNIRARFAGIGYTYDETRDVFLTPKCHDEAILNEETTEWDCINLEHEVMKNGMETDETGSRFTDVD